MSDREEIADQVSQLLSGSAYSRIRHLPTVEEVVSELLTDMPQVCILDFTSPTFDAHAVLKAIQEDAWLLQVGVIAIHDSADTADYLETLQGLNLIISLPQNRLAANLPTVFRMIESNRRLLLHRGLGEGLISQFTASFDLNNDVVEARCFVNLICNYLYNSGKLNAPEKKKAQLAITELLMNAIEHGNCGITSAEKTEWLEAGRDIQDLIAVKRSSNTCRGDKVNFEYSVHEDRASFRIADMGEGFDWASVLGRDKTPDLLALHGRGIMMTEMSVQNLTYHEKGNVVSFDLALPDPPEPLTPKLFQDQARHLVSPGDVVITEGDDSETVYYIASGRYDVLAGDKVVYCLTPDDIFIGEMAFLLGGARTATVVATSRGMLIPITREELARKIREMPHYGLFIAKLLAVRLARQNLKAYHGGAEVML